MIDRYVAIKKHAITEHKEEEMLKKDAAKAQKRAKRAMVLFLAALVMLALSLVGNLVIVFFVVDGQVTSTADRTNGAMVIKDTSYIMRTAPAEEKLPLMVAPVLDSDMLDEVFPLL